MILKSHHLQHISTWQASGLKQVDYCRQHGLNAKTFSRWFRLSQAPSQPPALVPVNIVPDDATPVSVGIRLQLRQGHSLELPNTVSPIWLAELLQCLG
jgi:hypothetical protein